MGNRIGRRTNVVKYDSYVDNQCGNKKIKIMKTKMILQKSGIILDNKHRKDTK